MYKRILVPVDGSSFSEQMLPQAAALARDAGASLTLLRVVEKADEQAAAAGYVESLAAGIGAQAACAVARNGVAAAIREESQQVPDTLVALCSHGRSGAMQALFGSVALEVLRGLGAPVLVYRPDPNGAVAPMKIGRIVVPLDGSEVSEAIIPEAAALAKGLHAKLLVVSVIDPSVRLDPGIPAGDVQESGYVHGCARDIADRYGVPVGWEVLHGDPKEAIPQFVRGLGDAMLAMTTHGRTGLKSVVAGSVTAECLRASGRLVLTRLP